MKKLSTAAFVFLLVLLSACTSRFDRSMVALETLLDSLESQFAPDGRVELWNLELSKTGRTLTLEGEVASGVAYDAISSSLFEHFPGAINLVKLLPEDSPDRIVNALVNNSVAHLRKAPSSKSELVSQVLLGAPVRILKEADEMNLIQVPDGYIGWVNVNEVHFMEPHELEGYRNRDKLIYSSQYGFSYSQPDESSLPVADLVIGCLLPLVSDSGAFYGTEYPDGRLAWVKKAEVILAADVFHKDPEREKLVLTAMAYHGIPYLWGGASAKNLDCSGFVSNVYFMNGIQMPRDADQQSSCGRELTTEFTSAELLECDLLFFG
jgi:cell wall-associated NlpC family hydrolase